MYIASPRLLLPTALLHNKTVNAATPHINTSNISAQMCLLNSLSAAAHLHGQLRSSSLL